MKKALDLQCLYKVFTDGQGYYFTTDKNISYRIVFERVDYLSDCDLYSVAVGSDDKKPPYDRHTEKTIAEVVKLFFKDKEKALIYLCSFEDEKGKARFEKFSRWFRNDDFHHYLVKIDGIISTEIDYYTSLIYHKENPTREKIEKDFLSIVKDLNTK